MKAYYILLMIALGAFVIAGCQAQQPAPVVPSQPPPPPTPQPSAPAIIPSVQVSDQMIFGSSVTVSRIISPEAGWMVIHSDSAGKPGPVIGHTILQMGTNDNVVVDIDTAKATPTLHAMLHIDKGQQGVYEFPGPDAPVTRDGNIVMTPFTVSGLAEPEGEEEYVVEMTGFRFVPETIRIEPGDSVRWVNRDSVLHTIAGFGQDVQVPAGGEFIHTFTADGVYDYACSIHPSMLGTVIVGDAQPPQAASTTEPEQDRTPIQVY